MLIFHFQFAVDPLLPLLVVMLLTMELTLEAMELLDGTLTTPTLKELDTDKFSDALHLLLLSKI